MFCLTLDWSREAEWQVAGRVMPHGGADIDTGFGSAINVTQVVERYEWAGAATVVI
jgi:hypothetical protein